MIKNYQYVQKMKDALNDGDLVLCYDTILEFFNINSIAIQDYEIIELNSLRTNFDKNENVESFDNFQAKLNFIVNQIAGLEDVKFEEYTKDNQDESLTIDLEPSKVDEIFVDNRLVDLEKVLQDFTNQWIGKIIVNDSKRKNEQLTLTLSDSKFKNSQEDIQIDEADASTKNKTIISEIKIVIDFKHRKVHLQGWGAEIQFDQFFVNVKGWWEREIVARSILKVFVSYCHEDEKWKDALVTSMAVLWQENRIELWHDRDIRGGDAWEDKILSKLKEAHIILLLISPEFIASRFCYHIETKMALEQHNKKISRVVPIFVRRTSDKQASYSHLQGYPKDKKPFSSFGTAKSDNDGIQQVADEMARIVEKIRITGKVVE